MNRTILELFPGPIPFPEKDDEVFFGRDTEIERLRELLQVYRTVLLHAQSGAGKTSLVQAGLVPMLKAAKIPWARCRVGGVSASKLNLAPDANPFIATLDADLRASALLACPPEAEHLLILDQFEDLFNSFPDRWEDREPLFKDLAARMRQRPGLRILFVTREEYVSRLEPFAFYLPEQFQIRMFLERLRGDAVRDAVRDPFGLAGVKFESDQLLDDFIDNLRKERVQKGLSAAGVDEYIGEFPDLLQLQVVCGNLARGLNGSGVKVIGPKEIKEFGNPEQSLVRFYEEGISGVSRKHAVKVARLRSWFEDHLITTGGTRGTAFMADDETEGLDNKIVKALEKEVHLLRCDVRAGARWYEITHDRLIAPIRQSNHDWTVARWKKLIRRGIVAAILAIPVSIYVYYLVDSARHTRIQQAERVVTKETKTQTTQELLVTAVKSRWDSDVAEGTAKALGDFLANSSYDFDARRKDLSDKVAQLAGTDRLQACETIHFVLSFFPRPAEGSVTLPNTTAAVRTLHRSVITPATTNVKDFAALHDYLCAHNAAVIVATVERKAMEDEQFNKVVADEVARWKRYGFADAIAARPTRRGAVQIAADYFLDMDEARDLMNTLKTKQISPYVVPCFVGIKNCDQKINTPIREYSLFDIPETK